MKNFKYLLYVMTILFIGCNSTGNCCNKDTSLADKYLGIVDKFMPLGNDNLHIIFKNNNSIVIPIKNIRSINVDKKMYKSRIIQGNNFIFPIWSYVYICRD